MPAIYVFFLGGWRLAVSLLAAFWEETEEAWKGGRCVPRASRGGWVVCFASNGGMRAWSQREMMAPSDEGEDKRRAARNPALGCWCWLARFLV